ncbi:E3 ubiquitin-protein ligase TRIM39 isoform X1 [Astyanax mexicanus]|uniref:E3 ubiquitin-protein ligase TRIM39 isoform X1 n=1 Tax=Astyanax mexicanus TaxID=7994 RepID=A0A8B9KCS9_ASTMX|nr:E3 ubiquitin-protein ligase TRIM39 isoform X1 [Astyanax mexicanus]
MKPQSQEMKLMCQERLKRQKEAVANRMKKLEAKQNEIKKKASEIRNNIERKYEEMRRVLEEDCRITLSLLEMEEQATVRALDDLIERKCSVFSDIEFQLSEGLMESEAQSEDMVTELQDRVEELLIVTDPSLVKLDEVKAEQILDLTNNLLLFIRSQTPIAKRLLKSCLTEVSLDPNTAHPKLIICPSQDCATFTNEWQDVSENDARFDTTLNVLSHQSWDSGRHYWVVDVRGKVYWELGLTYPSIPRKGRKEDCWLGRNKGSWCVEFFDGDYTAWHDGKSHPLPIGTHFNRIGIFCSFPAGLVMFLGEDSMTPLFAFCVGTFTEHLQLALCPGHDLQGCNSQPIKICHAAHPKC